jgi:hypothetical protein
MDKLMVTPNPLSLTLSTKEREPEEITRGACISGLIIF